MTNIANCIALLRKVGLNMKRSLTVLFLLVWCLALLGQAHVLADSAVWQAAPGPQGGSVAALVISPAYANDHSAFAGLRGQGVYRNVYGSATWQPIGLADQVIIDLAISPNFAVDHTLFAATGLGASGYQVYRSTDGGATWQEPDLTPYDDGFKPLIGLSISPNYSNDHTIYALGTTEMYKSINGGQVFTKMTGWYATHHVTAWAFSPAFAADHTIFASVQNNGILKSINGGGAWSPTAFADAYTALAVSPNYATDRIVVAIEANTGRMYFSPDGGETRIERDLTLATGAKQTIAFSPTFAADQLILAASARDAGAYRSINGGTTWTPVGWPTPSYPYQNYFVGGSIQAIAIPPNTVENGQTIAGTSSGLYVSNYRGLDWHQNNNGLPLLTLRTFAFAPNNSNTILAGTRYFDRQHANSVTPIAADSNLQISQNGGKSWQDVSGRIDQVRRVAFSPDLANDHTAFACAGAEGQDGYAGGGVYRSTSDGWLWTALISQAPCHDLALSPNYAIDHTAWAYVVGQGVVRTTNGGDTWNVVNNDFVAELLLVSPNYAIDHTLFASTSDARLLKSSDGGATWSPVLSYTITALAISPAYGASQTLYAGVKETINSSGELYRSEDGGTHWQKVTTGIPPIVNTQPAVISMIEFAVDGSILMGVIYGDTNSAVYRSVDGGQMWQAFGNPSEGGLVVLASLTSNIESDQRGAFTFWAGTAHALNWRDQQQRDPTEPGTWTGNGPWGGRAGLLAISPNFANDGIVFSGEVNMLRASEYGPGLFKSSDGAQTWRSVSQSANGSIAMGGEAVHAYTFSPDFAADHLVFASTSRGLYQSINSGDTWSVIEGVYGGFPGGVSGLVLAPDYPTSGEMIATGGWGSLVESRDFGQTWSGLSIQSSGMALYSPNFTVDHTIFTHGNNIYRSTDRGLSWTPVLTQGGYLSLSPQFGVDHTAFAASNSMTGGVSKTLDSGTTWTPVLNDYVRLYLSPQYGVDQTILALSDIGAGPYGANVLYRSLNGGATWITSTIGLTTTNIGGLILSPVFNTDQLIYAPGTDGLYRSTDGGVSWSPVSDFAGLSVSTVVFSPAWPAQPIILVGTPRSVYRSSDGGVTWARMQGVRLLNGTQLNLENDAAWFAGTGGGVFSSADRGQTWCPLGILSGYINELAVSPAYSTDHTLFVTTSCSGCGGVSIYRTADGGVNWQYVRSSNYSGALAISPQYGSDHTLFVLGSGVSRSTDGGDHWSTIGTWPPFSMAYQKIALPPNYPMDGTVFTAGPGFWRLPPGETQWQPATTGILSNSNVSAIAVAPDYATSHTLLAATVEYLSEGVSSNVWRSEDGGVNWQRSDVGLPAGEWRSLAFSPHYADDHTVYLTSSQQLYRSVDGGHSWIAVGATPDDFGLNQVAISEAGDVIVSSDAGVKQYRTGFRDVLINGDAEADSGWQFSSAAYATEINFHAQHTLRLGLPNGGNQPIDSFATQTVTIPMSATLAQLNLRFNPVSSEIQVAPQTQSGAGDAQYVRIVLSDTAAISTTLLWTLSNAQTWQRTSFDLTPYAGQTIELRFGAINDGQGGQTGLYVDNASLITLGPGGGKVFLPIILKYFTN
jgi:photosystem II stability/assembly factor-like uncharacterized protein